MSFKLNYVKKIPPPPFSPPIHSNATATCLLVSSFDTMLAGAYRYFHPRESALRRSAGSRVFTCIFTRRWITFSSRRCTWPPFSRSHACRQKSIGREPMRTNSGRYINARNSEVSAVAACGPQERIPQLSSVGNYSRTNPQSV